MVSFVRGRPVTTELPTVEVDPGLPAGLHRFRLVVVDERGRASRVADEVTLAVVRVVRPPIRDIGAVTPPRPPRSPQ